MTTDATSNLAELESCGHLHAWVKEHPDGWDDTMFRGLLDQATSLFGPIDEAALGQTLQRIERRLKEAPSGEHPVIATGFLDEYLAARPTALEGPGFEELLDVIHHGGLGPVSPQELRLMISRSYPVRTGPRRVVHTAPHVDRLQTVERLADADWADPYDIADSFAWRPGDFWLGRCPMSEVALGYRDQKHVLLVGGTRGGKGAGFIIPNHCLWPGSLFSIDPKGENANVTAARRGAGNDVCVPMGHKVHVLDPLDESHVAYEYRKGFNPLRELDVDDREVVTRAAELAEAIVVSGDSDDSTAEFFKGKAREFIKGLMLHVLTWKNIKDEDRHLGTVADLAFDGDRKFAATLNDIRAAADDEAGRKGKDRHTPLTPRQALFEAMKANEVFGPEGRLLPSIAEEIELVIDSKAGDQFAGFDGTLKESLNWLRDSPGIRDNLSRDDFRMSDLHTDPDGVSVYLVLPFGDMKRYNRWLRLLTTCAFRAMLKTSEPPASGHNVLFSLDEFPRLGHMETISDGLSTIAGYNVTLLVVVQYLQQLREEHYKKTWQAFHANTGLEIYFDIGDPDAEQLSKWLGETDLVVHARSANLSATGQESAGSNIAHADTATTADAVTQGKTVGGSAGTSETNTLTNTTGQSVGNTVTDGVTDTNNRTVTDGKGGSQGVGGGSQQGGSEGTNITQGKGGSEGGSRGGSSGGSEGGSKGSSDGLSTGKSVSAGDSASNSLANNWSSSGGGGGSTSSTGKSLNVTDSYNHNQSRNESANWNRNWGKTWGETWGQNWNQSIARSRGSNWSENASWNRNENWNRSVAEGQSHAVSHTHARSLTQTQSEAVAHAVGKTLTDTWSKQDSTTHTDSRGTTDTHGANLAVSHGRSAQGGISQTVMKRPLVTANTLRENLDPDAFDIPGVLGFSLVRMGGRRATIVLRTAYFSDVGFDGLYDRHPRHPETDPPPVIRPVSVTIERDPVAEPSIFGYVDEDGEAYASRVGFWHCYEGEAVRRGQPLYALQPGICEALGFTERVSVHAPFTGRLARIGVAQGEAFEPGQVLATMEVHLADLWVAQGEPLAEYELDKLGAEVHPMFARIESILDAQRRLEQAAEERVAREAEIEAQAREAERQRDRKERERVKKAEREAAEAKKRAADAERRAAEEKATRLRQERERAEQAAQVANAAAEKVALEREELQRKAKAAREEEVKEAFLGWHRWTPLAVFGTLAFLLVAVNIAHPGLKLAPEAVIGKIPPENEYIPSGPPWSPTREEERKEEYRDFVEDRRKYYEFTGVSDALDVDKLIELDRITVNEEGAALDGLRAAWEESASLVESRVNSRRRSLTEVLIKVPIAVLLLSAIGVALFVFRNRFIPVAWDKRSEDPNANERAKFFSISWRRPLLIAVAVMATMTGLSFSMAGEHPLPSRIATFVAAAFWVALLPILAWLVYETHLRVKWALEHGEVVWLPSKPTFRGPVHLFDD